MRFTCSFAAVAVLALTQLASAEAPQIQSFSASGEISWPDTNTNGHYSVEWLPSLTTNNWHKDWSPATRIVATGGVLKASIPMVFRVIHYPATSPAANMVLVAGGGQPQGPQYDFYMSKYEVTEQEFADFLNDAQANTNNARGDNMIFAVSGDVSYDAGYPNNMFDISDSNFIYFKDDPVGTRYSVFNDTMNHPATGVSWYGALKYCNWLTINEDRGLSERC